MFESTRASAAYHEAGHTVVSHAVGCRAMEASIQFSEQFGRWFGKHRTVLADDQLWAFMNMPVVLKRSAQVAVAGLLAEAKYHATQSLTPGPVAFIPDQDLSALSASYRIISGTEEQPGCTNLSFRDAAASREHRFEYSGFMFSTEDSKHLNGALKQADGLTAEGIVRDTMALLDCQGTWMAVVAVASALLDDAAGRTDGAGKIEEDRIDEIIRRAAEAERG